MKKTTKTTRTQKILRMALVNGFKRIGTVKNQLGLYSDAQLFNLLSRLQRRGLVKYEILKGTRGLCLTTTVATELYV